MSEARLVRPSLSDAVLVRDLDRPDLRAADADRDATAARLGAALAVGRLTSTEYAERLDATYAARTMGELAPLTRDLPEVEAGDGGPSTAGTPPRTTARRSSGWSAMPGSRPGSNSSTWVSRMLLPEGSRNDVSMP